MIKLLATGVWICAVALASVYFSVQISQQEGRPESRRTGHVWRAGNGPRRGYVDPGDQRRSVARAISSPACPTPIDPPRPKLMTFPSRIWSPMRCTRRWWASNLIDFP
jgi:hypothetical protein